ncbi:hypothetical protein HDU86_002655 [Geranomyces michiganensis]|nr:hypothetical protein HDU86_002655 [Geranomyces michiganensis]
MSRHFTVKEPILELVPLEGRDSFFEGRYGLEPCSLRGIVRVTQPFKNPLSLADTSVSFLGTSTSTAEDVVLIDCHSSVLPEDHDSLLQTGVHNFEWVVELPLEPLLPPTRKVVSNLGGYHRKLHRIKYRLLANLSWYGKVGKVRKEVVINVDPFLVWPGETGELAALMQPAPFRWDSITSVVQYDIAVANTVLGPGDALDFIFRVVPRGHVCENVKLKLIEFCDDVAVLPSNGSGVHSGAGRRKLLAWDWKSNTTDIGLEDFFHLQQHKILLPEAVRPNASTLSSEMHPTAAIRHQIEITILFDDAPAIRLECPVTILSVSVDVARAAVREVAKARQDAEADNNTPDNLTMRRNVREPSDANPRTPDVRPPPPPPTQDDAVTPTAASAGTPPLDTAGPGTGTAARKATTIKKRETVDSSNGGGGGGGASRQRTITTLRRNGTDLTPSRQHSSRQSPPPLSAPTPLTPTDLQLALTQLQDTLLAQAAANHDTLLTKLESIEVENKRLLRRVFQLEELVRGNNGEYEKENEISLRSSASSTNLYAQAMRRGHNQDVDAMSLSGRSKGGLKGFFNKK